MQPPSGRGRRDKHNGKTLDPKKNTFRVLKKIQIFIGIFLTSSSVYTVCTQIELNSWYKLLLLLVASWFAMITIFLVKNEN